MEADEGGYADEYGHYSPFPLLTSEMQQVSMRGVRGVLKLNVFQYKVLRGAGNWRKAADLLGIFKIGGGYARKNDMIEVSIYSAKCQLENIDVLSAKERESILLLEEALNDVALKDELRLHQV